MRPAFEQLLIDEVAREGTVPLQVLLIRILEKYYLYNITIGYADCQGNLEQISSTFTNVFRLKLTINLLDNIDTYAKNGLDF